MAVSYGYGVFVYQTASEEAASFDVLVGVVPGERDELVNKGSRNDNFSQTGRRKENRSRLEVAVKAGDSSVNKQRKS